MRILVCGGRAYDDYVNVRNVLNKFILDEGLVHDDEYRMPKDITIIHGGAPGADSCADQWAVANWTGLEVYKADWDEYGRAAGPIRNKLMITDGKPDIVLAFPGGRGTNDMKAQARAAGIEVREFS